MATGASWRGSFGVCHERRGSACWRAARFSRLGLCGRWGCVLELRGFAARVGVADLLEEVSNPLLILSSLSNDDLAAYFPHAAVAAAGIFPRVGSDGFLEQPGDLFSFIFPAIFVRRITAEKTRVLTAGASSTRSAAPARSTRGGPIQFGRASVKSGTFDDQVADVVDAGYCLFGRAGGPWLSCRRLTWFAGHTFRPASIAGRRSFSPVDKVAIYLVIFNAQVRRLKSPAGNDRWDTGEHLSSDTERSAVGNGDPVGQRQLGSPSGRSTNGGLVYAVRISAAKSQGVGRDGRGVAVAFGILGIFVCAGNG